MPRREEARVREYHSSTRADLSESNASPLRIRTAAPRTWWTRERVVVGLRRFYQDHQFAPTSTEEWHQITGRHGQRGGGHGGRRSYPSLYAVLRHFETFRQAWAAAGIEVGRRQESWSELEDWYLREGVGLIPRSELARDLNRTSDAVHRRLYDLGLHSYQRWGWTLHRLERVARVPRHRLHAYLERGDLPYLRGTKCVYVDPGDLIVVDEIDWQHPPPELEEAALQAWRERLVKVLAGQDWRLGRPFHAQPVVHSDRRWSPRLIRPGAKPVHVEPGDWVQVVGPLPRRTHCVGRRGRVHLVFWSTNRTQQNPARSGPEPQWMARVEFPRQRRRGLEPRVTYTLPLACLRVSAAPAEKEH